MTDEDRVVDSRSSDGGRTIRRRRLCLSCKRRFTTYEKTTDGFKLTVIKRDKSRIPYSRDNVLGGLEKACYKRPVSVEQVHGIADKTEEYIFRRYDKEVSSAVIGEQVMKYLRAVDNISYIRFASIYREFASASDLIKEVTRAIEEAEPLEQLKFFDE